MSDYAKTAKETRLKVLDLIYKHQTSHIGSNLSVIDMAVVLYADKEPEDVVIWSAGWKAATACVLENEPFISMLPTGSCGHGLPIAVGRAYAKKKGYDTSQLGEMDAWPTEGTVYCIMSEGELNEGTTWESAMFAAHHKLDNLVVLVDVNGYQAMGKTENIIGMKDISMKWHYFGWGASTVDGHNYDEMSSYLLTQDIILGKPHVLICDTVKGKGVDFMENNNLYHYKNLTKEEYEKAVYQITH